MDTEAKVDLGQLIRKAKKLFKNKWSKIVAISLGVFVLACLITYLLPWLAFQIVSLSIHTKIAVSNSTLLGAVLLINAMMSPIYVMETMKAVDRKVHKKKRKKSSRLSALDNILNTDETRNKRTKS